MTDEDIDRIDKQFDSLEETLRGGFARMDIVLANQLMLLGQVNARLDDEKRRADERHAEILAAIKGMRG